MGGPKRPRAELIKLLADQRAALAASCEGYDKGNEWEAARLATTVFTLVHDGGSITSLLTQLHLRASMRLLSSGRSLDPKNVSSTPPLLMVVMASTGTAFRPRLAVSSGSENQRLQRVQFATWWQKEVIFKDHRIAPLTRMRLVFALRHQDGGGHIGELTDKSYVHLKAGGGWFGNQQDGTPGPMLSAASATMRQIAWELTETLGEIGELS